MKEAAYSVTSLLSTLLLLIASTSPALAAPFGDKQADDQAIRLYSYPAVGPIGIAKSLGTLVINGHLAQGDQTLWNDDLVQARDQAATVLIDSVGKLTFRSGSVARLATGPSGSNQRGAVLILSLARGEIEVGLCAQSSSYMEAAGSAFTASRGGRFSIALRGAQVTVTAADANTTIQEQVPQHQYTIRPVGGSSILKVKARSTRQLQFRVTDEHDREIPDVPVLIIVGEAGGTVSSGAATGASVTVTTSAHGIATASFTAGNSSGTASITASVPGANASTTMSASISTGLSATATAGIVAAAAAAGGVAAGVAASRSGSNRNSSTAGPPVVTP